MSVNPGQFWGKGVDALFPASSGFGVAAAPFPRAKRRKDVKDYDPDVVGSAMKAGELQDIDPRTLHASQPSVTREGVAHYASGSTELFADQDRPTNQHPLVYKRDEGDGNVRNVLLTGHHRASAALANAELLKAIVAEGSWGPSRKS